MQDIRLAVLGLALACASQSLLAAPASSAKSTVTGITFKLIDLDPNDGIKPSLTMDPNWAFANMNTNPANGESVWETVSGSVFSNTSGSAVSSDGTLSAAKNKNGLSSSVTLNEGQLNALVNPAALGVADHSSYGMNRVSANADAYSWPLQWTLSAHTQLVITGTVSLTASTDVSSLAASSLVSGVDGQAWTLAAETRSLVSAVLDHPLDTGAVVIGIGDEVSPDHFLLSATAVQSVDQLGLHTTGAGTNVSNQGSFNLHYENTSNAAVQGSFAINAWVSTALSAKAYPAIDPPVVNIPEPGTFALMGLGLGLLAWRQRGRQV